jgi:hypothetical protein
LNDGTMLDVVETKRAPLPRLNVDCNEPEPKKCYTLMYGRINSAETFIERRGIWTVVTGWHWKIWRWRLLLPENIGEY